VRHKDLPQALVA